MGTIILLFVLGSLAASSNPVFIKIATREIPPLTFTALRFLGAALVLLPFWYQKRQKLAIKDITKVLPYSLNMMLFAIGIQYSSVIMAGILYSLSPMVTAALAHLFIKEKFMKNQIFGLIFAVVGVGFLFEGSIKTADILSFGTPLGNLLILLAVLIWSLYPVSGRVLSKSYDSSTIIFYNTLLTGVLVLLISPFEWLVRPITLSAISTETVMSIFGAAVFGSAIAHFCYQVLIKRTTAFVSSFVQYTGVLASIMYGALIFGERVTIQLVIGALFIIVGVFLATTYTQLKKKR